MGQYATFGFVVIVTVYATVGAMAAAGTFLVTQKILGPKAEQIFFGAFLVMIAAFYLGFLAYFGVATAWRTEGVAVLVFAAIGLLGARFPAILIVGYPLHGIWDMLHEFQQHGAYSAFDAGQLTTVPLAYGIFCAVYDLSIAVYAYARRDAWSGAWDGRTQ